MFAAWSNLPHVIKGAAFGRAGAGCGLPQAAVLTGITTTTDSAHPRRASGKYRRAMDREQPALRLEGDDGDFIHVTWGRSGKRAIVSIAGPRRTDVRQCTLTADDAAELARFLAAGPDGQ
jgi:hypothetical protein